MEKKFNMDFVVLLLVSSGSEITGCSEAARWVKYIELRDSFNKQSHSRVDLSTYKTHLLASLKLTQAVGLEKMSPGGIFEFCYLNKFSRYVIISNSLWFILEQSVVIFSIFLAGFFW
jgi:hypothetical protein